MGVVVPTFRRPAASLRKSFAEPPKGALGAKDELTLVPFSPHAVGFALRFTGACNGEHHPSLTVREKVCDLLDGHGRAEQVPLRLVTPHVPKLPDLLLGLYPFGDDRHAEGTRE